MSASLAKSPPVYSKSFIISSLVSPCRPLCIPPTTVPSANPAAAPLAVASRRSLSALRTPSCTVLVPTLPASLPKPNPA